MVYLRIFIMCMILVGWAVMLCSIFSEWLKLDIIGLIILMITLPWMIKFLLEKWVKP